MTQDHSFVRGLGRPRGTSVSPCLPLSIGQNFNRVDCESLAQSRF